MFKFALDQKVYFMKNNAINCAAVSRRSLTDYTSRENARINTPYLGKVTVTYLLSNGDEMNETNMFASESNLVAFLTNNIVIDKAAV